MPTVCPPQFLGLEFTEKVAPHEAVVIPRPIEIYRLGGASRAQSTPIQLALADTVSDQEEKFGPGAAPPVAVRQPIQVGSRSKAALSVRSVRDRFALKPAGARS